MPVVGTRRSEETAQILRNYEKDPMHGLSEQFLDVATGVLNENGLDIFSEPSKYFMHESAKEQMRNFFVENSYDVNDPKFKDAEAIQEHEDMMNALFDNDMEAIQESAPLGAFNPVIGITFPMHKNLLFNCVFDKVVPKDVAQSPKFTLTMETRILVDTEGNEIDIFLEQNKIHDAVKNSIPTKDVIIPLPENNSYDPFGATDGAFPGVDADLSIKTGIVGVVVATDIEPGATFVCGSPATAVANGVGSNSSDPVAKAAVGTTMVNTTGSIISNADVIMPIRQIEFVPYYGEFDFTVVAPITPVKVTLSGVTSEINAVITGYMKKNKFMLQTSNSAVKSIVMRLVLDVSSAKFETCYTKWSARTDIFQIPEAPHISTTVSPEEIKDINALYQVNQLTKIMSIMNLALANYKDDEIHQFLDDSFRSLPTNQQFSGSFDFAPPTNYLQDPVAWRNVMFMDQLDSYVTTMLQVLNDENMTISIVGRPDIIRRITPTEYTYTTPSSIGPVELEFQKTVVTSDKRVYQFVSSSKMRNNNNLIIILVPRNTNRVMYKLFDYQFYVSNEIRTTSNYQLPAVTAFERFKMIQYQPVQGRLRIVNPRGMREVLTNIDPIGQNAMNDFTANANDYTSTINGVDSTGITTNVAKPGNTL